jgi:hypothetical protein
LRTPCGARDTAATIQRARFTIAALDHYLFPPVRTPFSFHTLRHRRPPLTCLAGDAGRRSAGAALGDTPQPARQLALLVNAWTCR